MRETTAAASPYTERRHDVRIAATDAVRVVTSGGHVFDAVAVDRSLRGMRVSSPHVASFSSELTLLVPSAGVAHLAHLVWRTAPYAGLLLLRTVEMRAASSSSEAELRRLWREHVGHPGLRAG